MPNAATLDDELFSDFDQAIRQEDGRAAQEHLNAGRPIYFRTPETPYGTVVKKHPDGRTELVAFGRYGERPLTMPE